MFKLVYYVAQSSAVDIRLKCLTVTFICQNLLTGTSIVLLKVDNLVTEPKSVLCCSPVRKTAKSRTRIIKFMPTIVLSSLQLEPSSVPSVFILKQLCRPMFTTLKTARLFNLSSSILDVDMLTFDMIGYTLILYVFSRWVVNR